MKSYTLLRISSIISALFATGHTAGAPWTPANGAPENVLIESMKSLHFTVMGSERTYWDFYFGFGLSVSVYIFTLAILLWQLASLAKRNPQRTRPMMLTMLAAYVAISAVTLKFFFVAPIVLSLLACVLIASAWFQARREF